MRLRPLHTLGTIGLVGLLLVGSASPVLAACHAFGLQVSPARADKGETVEVTVTRDAAVADSSVRVRTQESNARAGTHFTPLDETVSFTGSSTQQSFQISILDDDAASPARTFTVALSDPGGCAVNPNFSLAAPVTVTINAVESPAPDPAPPAPAPPADPPAPPPAPEAEPTPEVEVDIEEEPAEEEGGGVPAALVLGILALIAAAGIAAFMVNKRRTRV